MMYEILAIALYDNSQDSSVFEASNPVDAVVQYYEDCDIDENIEQIMEDMKEAGDGQWNILHEEVVYIIRELVDL